MVSREMSLKVVVELFKDCQASHMPGLKLVPPRGNNVSHPAAGSYGQRVPQRSNIDERRHGKKKICKRRGSVQEDGRIRGNYVEMT